MNYMLMMSITSLFYSIVLTIIFLTKKNINNSETRIYKAMLSILIAEILLEIFMRVIAPYMSQLKTLNIFVSKFFVFLSICWFLLLTLYNSFISFKDNDLIDYHNKNKKILIIALVISVLMISALNIDFYYKGNDNYYSYTYGPAVTYTFAVFFFLMFMNGIMLFKSIKNLSKKYVPIILSIVLFIICGVIQKINPMLILNIFVQALVTFIMYHTIENPDMKLLKEMHEAKEISDNANEEKTLFLYNMTQEIRATTKNIDNEADNIINSDDIEFDKESARNIKGETSKFRMMTNDILDVSAIDSANIKIYNSSYNLKLLLRTIIGSYTEVCKNKNLEFRTNIEHNIPESLYGDNINLKKVINQLLTYCVKATSKGYVELDINTIIKGDIVRLIITIEDSSMGIKSSDLEKIKMDNKNISESYKLITLMNGAMVITSNYGTGNKIKIILDQKIDKSENKEEKKYQEIYNNKKILIIDNSEPSIKIIEKLLKNSNIEIDYSLNGKDAYKKIATRNRYDLILLDEELNTITGTEMLENLKKIRNFNIPVILLSKDNKYEYNEEYLNMGFSDILIKPIKKEILLEKINKNIINREDIFTQKNKNK